MTHEVDDPIRFGLAELQWQHCARGGPCTVLPLECSDRKIRRKIFIWGTLRVGKFSAPPNLGAFLVYSCGTHGPWDTQRGIQTGYTKSFLGMHRIHKKIVRDTGIKTDPDKPYTGTSTSTEEKCWLPTQNGPDCAKSFEEGNFDTNFPRPKYPPPPPPGCLFPSSASTGTHMAAHTVHLCVLCTGTVEPESHRTHSLDRETLTQGTMRTPPPPPV